MNHKFRDRPCAGWAHDAGPGWALRLGTRRMQRAAVELGWGLCWAMALPAAQAATITVDGSTCDLQDAVVAANTDAAVGGCPAGAGADTLVLTANQTYTLDYAKRADDSTGIFIGSPVTIEGHGATIRRATDNPNQFRLMSVVNGGELTIRDATLTGGSLLITSGANGGAINNSKGTLNIERCSIVSNTVFRSGGGLYNEAGSTMTVRDSRIDGNASTLSFANRSLGALAGGISNFGNATITRSILSGNRAFLSGGAIGNTGTLTVRESLIANNHAPGQFAGRAGCLAASGGIYNEGTLEVTDSTLFGNTSIPDLNRTGCGRGAAIQSVSRSGNTTLLRNTVVGNVASDDEDPFGGAGGLYFGSGTHVLIGNLVAGNRNRRGFANEVGADGLGTFTLDRNLLGDDGETSTQAFSIFLPRATDLTATADGDGVSQRTGPAGTPLESIVSTTLADNGGPTQTLALPAGSPALDAISPANTTACPPGGSDQRGAPRGQDGDGDASTGCDIGAVERQITDLDLGFLLGATVITAGGSSPGTDGIEVTLSLANLGPGTSVGSRLKMQWNAPLIFEGLSPACTVTPLSFECPGEVYAPGQTVVLRPTLRADASQPQDVQIRLVADFIPAAADVDPVPATGHAERDLLVQARDGTPDAFTFGRRDEVERSQLVQSDVLTISGINHAVDMTIAGGEYQRVNFNSPPQGVRGVCSATGRWRSDAVLVRPGDMVCVRHTSASGFSGDTVTTLTIGGVSGTFTTTTLARDITPDAFSFQPVGDAALETLQTSNAVTITGINDSTPFSVQGGRAGLNGGPCTAVNGTLRAGTNVVVCHVASPRFGTATTTTLTVGASGVLTGVSADFTSTTLSAPAATLTPTSLAFAGQRVGTTSAAQTTTLRNTGAAALAISAIDSSNAAFTVTHDCPAALARDASCTISTRFAPGSTGPFDGQVTVASNDPRGLQVATVNGTGIAPLLTVDATTVAFGSQRVGQPASLRTVTVRNPGSDALALTSIAVTGPGFARDGGSCGSTLAAGGSCTIGVRFSPGVSGAAAGSLAIGSDGGAATVSLSGTGTAPALSLSERSLSFGRAGVIRFGEIRVGQTSKPQTITATNTGTAPLSISSIRTTGDFVQSTTCGKTLAVNASCTISLRFKPSTPGDRSGETLITSDALTSPDRITLGGRGIGVAVKR